MVVWSWLTFPSVCPIICIELACSNHVGCFIAGFGGNSSSETPLAGLSIKSFRYTPGNSGQVLRCASPFEATSSKTLLHSALSRSIKWALCVANYWVAHELCSCWSWPIVGERHTNSSLRSQQTLRFSLAHSCRLTRGEASCVCDGTLYSGLRKECSRTKAWSATTESGFEQWPCRRSSTATRSTTHALIECLRSPRLPRGW